MTSHFYYERRLGRWMPRVSHEGPPEKKSVEGGIRTISNVQELTGEAASWPLNILSMVYKIEDLL